jgi:hypothetical protein
VGNSLASDGDGALALGGTLDAVEEGGRQFRLPLDGVEKGGLGHLFLE